MSDIVHRDHLVVLMAAQQRTIEALEARLARLEDERAIASVPRESAADHHPLSRRALFGLAGAGIAGVAVGGAASPAAAADGDPVLLGQTNISTTTTSLTGGGSGATLAVEGGADAAALEVDASGASGVSVTTTSESGHGVIADAQGAQGVGVWGLGPSVGTAGTSAGGLAISGQTSDGAAGWFSADSGTHLVLVRNGDLIGPPTTSIPRGSGSPQRPGMISLDSAGDLFLCTEAGDPGTWTRLNHQGPTFLPTAQRAFDSRGGRQPIPGGGAKGRFTAGSNRIVDLTVATDLPTDARAATVNLTVTNTGGAGYLSVYPGGANVPTTPAFSHLNWFSSGQTIANTTVVTPEDGAISIYASAPTDVVVDVIGYHT